MAANKKSAISFYEASQDISTFTRLGNYVVQNTLEYYGLQEVFKDIRVQMHHCHDVAAMDLVISVLPQQLSMRHRYSYPYITASGFETASEDAIKSGLYAVIKDIENSPYFKQKMLTSYQKDERIKALEAEVKILQETIQANLNANIEFSQGEQINLEGISKYGDAGLTQRFKQKLKEE